MSEESLRTFERWETFLEALRDGVVPHEDGAYRRVVYQAGKATTSGLDPEAEADNKQIYIDLISIILHGRNGMLPKSQATGSRYHP